MAVVVRHGTSLRIQPWRHLRTGLRGWEARRRTVVFLSDTTEPTSDAIRAVVEQLGDVVSYRYRVLPQPGYEYISGNVTDLIGHGPDEFYADPMIWERLVHPDDRDALQQMFEPGSPAITVRWQCADGGMRWVRQTARPALDDAGQMIAFEGVVLDVTPIVEAHDDRRRHALQLHDDVVQGLAVARLAFDVRDEERLDTALRNTLDAAQRLVRELFGEDLPGPGELRRSG